MNRVKERKETINFMVEPSIIRKLDEIAKRQLSVRSKLVREGVVMFIEKVERQQKLIQKAMGKSKG